ncbi:MAG: bifunctional 23S rRNA (guanine(2069)-N(7))-methyltransferase RlmK/23S rRNA (guanine(2445)-N(2))-methyltransferase RlmL [Acidobacteriota bacterium]|nr:bifunctional 23S rRNA (guanine(2069)-N(7))-methyltransferase RlmK/23S rRNA (guanine(2445)-N(2))-methyltransferase RlmL [Acidobacteriota bacterium]
MPRFFATCSKGLEELLVAELNELDIRRAKQALAGVHFEADWPGVYRVLLWTRLAGRILHPLAEFEAPDTDTLYRETRKIDWCAHFDLNQSFAVDATVSGGSRIKHSKYAALKVKDAVVDTFREQTGARPNVDREKPDLQLNLVVQREKAVLSLDFSGAPLHQRGYRRKAGAAPLKENLAAAILIRAGWPQIAETGGSLVDPMCGSGTFLVEGFMMAADIAPGLQRKYYGIFGWKQFDTGLWSQLKNEATERREAGLVNVRASVSGFDHDRTLLQRAENNIRRAGLAGKIQTGNRELSQWKPANTRGWQSGLVVVNPPYGERLGDMPELPALYVRLGTTLTTCFQGWKAAVFTGNPNLGKQMGLRARKRNKLYNGAIACDLLHFDVSEEWFVKRQAAGGEVTLTEGGIMFANRLRKNLKGLRKWIDKENIQAYRLYDADMPEYNVAVDRVGSMVVVYEYAAPSGIDPDKAERRLHEVLLAIPGALNVPSGDVVLKQRRRQKKGERYERLERRNEFLEIRESDMTFLVNPWDYLDVGLFCDHRPIRRRIRDLAEGKRFLNLFAYTGSATVAAAAGGAVTTTTLDLSAGYLDWAGRNMAINGFSRGPNHMFLRDEAMSWLKQCRATYDLIFLDPPTFSNSKKFHGSFDVQRDQVFMIEATARLLSKDGLLIFSNNYRRFKLEREALEAKGLIIRDITVETIPPDYARNPKIHNCFEIEWR